MKGRRSSPFKTPEELSEWMKKNIITREFAGSLMSHRDVYHKREGSSHDQVMYAVWHLQKMGYTPSITFIMEHYDKLIGATHSFITYEDKNGRYWFENAWEDQAGIHVYDRRKDLISYFRNVWHEEMGNKDIYPEILIERVPVSKLKRKMSLKDIIQIAIYNS